MIYGNRGIFITVLENIVWKSYNKLKTDSPTEWGMALFEKKWMLAGAHVNKNLKI